MDKMPVYRWRDAFRLAGWLKRDGPVIAKELEPKMAAVLEEGEELPDLAHLLDVLGRMVLAEHANLDRREGEKRRHNTNAFRARGELRREAMPMLRSRVQDVRKWMRSHLSPEEVKQVVDYKGRTPRSDEGLEDLAIALVRGLIDQEPLPSPAGPIDLAGWARYLQEPLLQTSGLLDDLGEALEDRSLSAEKKKQAMTIYDKLFRRVAGVGRLFYRMAGLEWAADKLVYDGGRPAEKIKKQGRVVA